jgi:hypothetical protein
VKNIVWFLNSWAVTRTCVAIDRAFTAGGVFAMGYSLAPRKNQKVETLLGRPRAGVEPMSTVGRGQTGYVIGRGVAL